jgi:hypothetical protein
MIITLLCVPSYVSYLIFLVLVRPHFFGTCFYLVWDVEYDRVSIQASYIRSLTVEVECE